MLEVRELFPFLRGGAIFLKSRGSLDGEELEGPIPREEELSPIKLMLILATVG